MSLIYTTTPHLIFFMRILLRCHWKTDGALVNPKGKPVYSYMLKYRYMGDILHATSRSVILGIRWRKGKKYGVYKTLTDALEVFEHGGRVSAKVGNIKDCIWDEIEVWADNLQSGGHCPSLIYTILSNQCQPSKYSSMCQSVRKWHLQLIIICSATS